MTTVTAVLPVRAPLEQAQSRSRRSPAEKSKKGDRVKPGHIFIYSVLMVFLLNGYLYADEHKVLLREDFNNLAQWKPLFFPKIKKHTEYTIEKEDVNSYLKAESNASASGILLNKEFNIYDYPKVKWSWKINNIYKKGNAAEKSGDDYPIRVYIIFKYDPADASFGTKLKYGLAKVIYGEYPPHSSLNYIWGSKTHEKRIITSPYASQAKMLVLQAGDINAGKWFEEKIDIIEDYKKAFGEDPPSIASLAIMNDSDNTGESSISYIDFIEVYK